MNPNSGKRTRRSGLTVLELVVTVGISLVLFSLLFQAMSGLLGLSSTTLTMGRLEESAGRSTTKIASELRWADPDSLLITAESGSSRVDCRLAEGWDGAETVWSTPVSFRYVPSNQDTNENGVADEGSIVRVQDGRTRTLCSNVTEGGFVIGVENGAVTVEVTVVALDREGRALAGTSQAAAHLLNRSSW